MLLKQMLTESEAFIIVLMTTLKIFQNEIYEKTFQEIYHIISTRINNIIEKCVVRFVNMKFYHSNYQFDNAFVIFSVPYGKEHVPVGLALMDSISRTFFTLPNLNNIIVSKPLVSLRDRIYAKLIGT